MASPGLVLFFLTLLFSFGRFLFSSHNKELPRIYDGKSPFVHQQNTYLRPAKDLCRVYGLVLLIYPFPLFFSPLVFFFLLLQKSHLHILVGSTSQLRRIGTVKIFSNEKQRNVAYIRW